MVRHRIAAVLATAGLCLAVVGGGTLAAQAAPAAPSFAKCTLSGQEQIFPGLKTTPQSEQDQLFASVGGTGTSACTGNAGVTRGGISPNSGANQANIFLSSNQSCTTGKATGTIAVIWSNGTISVGSATLKASKVAGVLSLRGAVTGGSQANLIGGKISGHLAVTVSLGNCTVGVTLVDLQSVNATGTAPAPIRF